MTTKVKDKLVAGIGKVSNAIADAFGKQAKSGNIVTQVCKTCATVFNGRAATDAELKHIAESVTRIQGWSEKSAGPRKSEVRKIVRNYRTLPEAVALLAKKSDTFSWHDAMRLLTQLNNDNNNVKQAVAAMVSNNATRKPSAIRQLEAALKRAMSIESEASKVVAAQEGIMALCAKLDIDCGYE